MRCFIELNQKVYISYPHQGYWIEIIRRAEEQPLGRFTLSQTMMRVKDPKASLEFYEKTLGMTLVGEKHFGPEQGDFSLYFLASLPEGTEIPSDVASEEVG